jgi:hypothetical protein
MVPSGSLSTLWLCQSLYRPSNYFKELKTIGIVIMEDVYKYGKKFPAFKKRYGSRR